MLYHKLKRSYIEQKQNPRIKHILLGRDSSVFSQRPSATLFFDARKKAIEVISYGSVIASLYPNGLLVFGGDTFYSSTTIRTTTYPLLSALGIAHKKWDGYNLIETDQGWVGHTKDLIIDTTATPAKYISGGELVSHNDRMSKEEKAQRRELKQRILDAIPEVKTLDLLKVPIDKSIDLHGTDLASLEDKEVLLNTMRLNSWFRRAEYPTTFVPEFINRSVEVERSVPGALYKGSITKDNLVRI